MDFQQQGITEAPTKGDRNKDKTKTDKRAQKVKQSTRVTVTPENGNVSVVGICIRDSKNVGIKITRVIFAKKWDI